MMDIIKLSLHDYENVQELSSEELYRLISEISDIEEVLPALNELYRRNSEQAIILGKKILENNEGDEYLQASVVEFIFEYDKQYVVDFTKKNIAVMHWYIYVCVLNCFSMESNQNFEEKLSQGFIKTVLNKYNYYENKERDQIKEAYELFLKSYSNTI